MDFKTADLHDEYGTTLQVASPIFRSYGGKKRFQGEIETIEVDEDFQLIKETLQTAGNNRVLIIDGRGSLRCALLGDRLAEMAASNSWNGLIIHGCIRDSDEINQLPIGVKALGTCPVKPGQTGKGNIGVPVQFADVTFTPGHYVYADSDGVLISANKI